MEIIDKAVQTYQDFNQATRLASTHGEALQRSFTSTKPPKQNVNTTKAHIEQACECYTPCSVNVSWTGPKHTCYVHSTNTKVRKVQQDMAQRQHYKCAAGRPLQFDKRDLTHNYRERRVWRECDPDEPSGDNELPEGEGVRWGEALKNMYKTGQEIAMTAGAAYMAAKGVDRLAGTNIVGQTKQLANSSWNFVKDNIGADIDTNGERDESEIEKEEEEEDEEEVDVKPEENEDDEVVEIQIDWFKPNTCDASNSDTCKAPFTV